MERCCQNCFHSKPLHGLAGVSLMCENRAGYKGVSYAVVNDDVCWGFRQSIDVPELPAGVRSIPLTRGKFALVDERDYADLVQHSWYAHRCNDGGQESFYAARKPAGDQMFWMHRVIMGAGPGEVVDHINHNGLDNRRSNLRVCSHAENTRNSRGRRGSTSQYKGVSYDRHRDKWMAQIRLMDKKINLGRFESEVAAAKAYNEKARELFGEFAYLNEVG